MRLSMALHYDSASHLGELAVDGCKSVRRKVTARCTGIGTLLANRGTWRTQSRVLGA
jgi:hypothetical protein